MVYSTTNISFEKHDPKLVTKTSDEIAAEQHEQDAFTLDDADDLTEQWSRIVKDIEKDAIGSISYND